jgi:phage tail-like protein
MSFLGGGLLGSALGSMVGGALDTVLSNNEVMLKPIPTFYFEVDIFDSQGYSAPKIDDIGSTGGGGLGSNLLSAAKSVVGMSGNNSLTLKPGENWHEKAFIEITGLEMEIDTESKLGGGHNFTFEVPNKRKNQHVTLKRLYRPKNQKESNDKWTKWLKETFDASAYWKKAIETKVVQITLFHPNLSSGGTPLVLYTISLYDAYPVKQSFGSFNSTSEDLMTQEIEIAYSNTYGGYNAG